MKRKKSFVKTRLYLESSRVNLTQSQPSQNKKQKKKVPKMET